MTAEEAVRAALDIKPSIAIPMHYGSVVGTIKDAEVRRRIKRKDRGHYIGKRIVLNCGNIKMLQQAGPQEIIYIESLDSTNRLAMELGDKGALHGTVVIAGSQTKGRGGSAGDGNPRPGLIFT